MHRLLKLGKIPFQNIQPVSFSTLVYNPYRFRNCVLCKQTNAYNKGKEIDYLCCGFFIIHIFLEISIRNRSIDTSPLILVTTRKRRKKARTYAEILEGIQTLILFIRHNLMAIQLF